MIPSIPIEEIIFFLETEESDPARELETKGRVKIAGDDLDSFMKRIKGDEVAVNASYLVEYDYYCSISPFGMSPFGKQNKIILCSIDIEKISSDGGLIQELI